MFYILTFQLQHIFFYFTSFFCQNSQIDSKSQNFKQKNISFYKKSIYLLIKKYLHYKILMLHSLQQKKDKLLSKKSKKLRFISLFWDYVSALSLILLLMLFWKLGKGPIEVNFLRPYIIQALTNDTSSYDLNVKSVNLELVHSVQPIKIIAKYN